jgi:hypothetical protein
MDITEIKIFRIDFNQDSVDTIDESNFPTDFNLYLKGLIELMISGSSGRVFRFDSDTTQVRGQIATLLNAGDFSNVSTTIANRLLRIEQTAQADIAHLGIEIQKGIVVQALINDGGISKYVICKADHNEFINELNFKLTRGLPIKKKVFKGFICSLNTDQTITDNLVYDQLQTKYWWQNFLELTKVHSDEDNTQNAFDAIDKGVLIKLKKKHPQDYMHLSNSNVRYFRAKDNFDMNEYIAEVFDGYQPFDSELNIEDIKRKIRSMPSSQKKPFDEQFSIVKKQIKKRFIKEIPLTPQIELHFKEEVPNLESVVTAELGADGTKYVRVRSEQGYQYFSNHQTEDK